MDGIALLTWKPDRCPRCATKMRVHPDDWAARSTLGCPECGLLIARLEEAEAIRAACATGSDLPLVAPQS